MSERLRDTEFSWLVSHGEVAVYWYAVVAFWGYTTLTRVLVRALWYETISSAAISSPGLFTLAHVTLAPGLIVAHAAAYKIGFPKSHRSGSAFKHVLIVLFVMLVAKFSFMAISAYRMLTLHEPHIGTAVMWWLTDAQSGLIPSIELGSLYCVGLALAAGVVNWRRFHLEAIARSKLALDAERSRSMALRRQLDPHSLYNTLNAIAGSVRSAPSTAIEMISGLGELLRLTLRDEVVESNLADEFSIAAKYLALYGLRYPEKLSVYVKLEEACQSAAIPPLLLQPLVENAALHGIESGCDVVEVRIQASEAATQRVEIMIANTSTPDARPVSPEHSSGIGLRNTWERLQLSYGNDFSFNWVQGPQNMAVLRLEIPRMIPTPAPRVSVLRERAPMPAPWG